MTAWMEAYGATLILWGSVVTAAGILLRFLWPVIALGLRNANRAAMPEEYGALKSIPGIASTLERCTETIERVETKIDGMENRLDDQSRKYQTISTEHALLMDEYKQRRAD